MVEAQSDGIKRHWNESYWDAVTQITWTPRFMGMEKLNAKILGEPGGSQLMNAIGVHSSQSVYHRTKRDEALLHDLRRLEEPLNQVCNIGFAIAPDALIDWCFARHLGDDPETEFVDFQLAGSINERYGWSRGANVTQPDMLFDFKHGILCVEMKLGSPTSFEQLMKYVSLFFLDAKMHDTPRRYGLLFVVPDDRIGGIWRECGLDQPVLSPDCFERAKSMRLPKKVAQALQDERLTSASAARIRLGAIGWGRLVADLRAFRDGLDGARPGDQALERLIDGLDAQIRLHPKTGVPARPTPR